MTSAQGTSVFQSFFTYMYIYYLYSILSLSYTYIFSLYSPLFVFHLSSCCLSSPSYFFSYIYSVFALPPLFHIPTATSFYYSDISASPCCPHPLIFIFPLNLFCSKIVSYNSRDRIMLRVICNDYVLCVETV